MGVAVVRKPPGIVRSFSSTALTKRNVMLCMKTKKVKSYNNQSLATNIFIHTHTHTHTHTHNEQTHHPNPSNNPIVSLPWVRTHSLSMCADLEWSKQFYPPFGYVRQCVPCFILDINYVCYKQRGYHQRNAQKVQVALEQRNLRHCFSRELVGRSLVRR